VPATTVAGCARADHANTGQISARTCRASHHSVWLAYADQANRGQGSALTCHICHHSGCLGTRRPSDQRPEQRPHLSFQPPQWLAEPTPSKQTVTREGPSPVVPSTTGAGCTHSDRANRSQTSTLTCRARHHSCWLSPRQSSEQRPDQRPHLSCPPPQ
jgi:hypothetical protein